MILLDYHLTSGATVATWETPNAESRHPALAAGSGRIPLLAADGSDAWVDPAAVIAMRDQREIDHAQWLEAQPSPEPWTEPDWSACLRECTESPAYLVGAVDNTLHLDLLAGGDAGLINIPPFSALDIRGATRHTVSLPDGEDQLSIGIAEPGTYHLTLRSARHLPQEWTIHAI